MPRHKTQEEITEELLNEIKNHITRNNVRVAIPLLKWIKQKIDLSYEEYVRQQTYRNSNIQQGAPRFVKRGSIYRTNLGKNIGSEQNGTARPVLIVQNQKFNSTSTTVLAIPLTDYFNNNGNPKKLMNTHIEIEHESLDKKSIIKVEHLKSISKNRLKSEICTISEEKMIEVENKLKLSLDLK